MSMTQAEGGAAAAATITQLHTWLGRQDALMTQLTTGIAELPLLTETVEKCTGMLGGGDMVTETYYTNSLLWNNPLFHTSLNGV